MEYLKRLLVASCLLGFSLNAYSALPTLQVHGVDSIAYDISTDEDTWLLTDLTGSLELIGTFGPNIVSIDNAYLVLTTSDSAINPFGADYTQFDDSDAFAESLETGLTFNNHSPFGSGASQVETYAYDLSQLSSGGSFARLGPTKDCNADIAGTTLCEDKPNSEGEIKMFDYDFSGLSLDWVHFDMVALVTDDLGRRGWVSSWDINPGSHDTTWRSVPESTSLLLLMVGLLGLVAVKRKA